MRLTTYGRNPLLVALCLDVGHGGPAASVAVSWLGWQLRGNATAAARFVGETCGLCNDPQWKIERRNFTSAAVRP